jgi:gamma-glutamylcyclotransferase (GGCT)/AIG2-like uncharacterized protein YtfP
MSTGNMKMFVYGTLMSHKVMSKVLKRPIDQNLSFHGILKGFQRFAIRGVSYPGIKPNPESQVEGLIWDIDPTEDDLKLLDDFEDEGIEYNRVTLIVQGAEDKEYECYVYVYHPDQWDRLEGEWVFDHEKVNAQYG